ncbi:glutamine synthetase [Rhodospirillum rubrum]|uniref:glutamine synthetase family protein n=1 Tax=Rhodospirillum rubrum TaxID=1085 RepID=UPI001902EBA0|nr:glutamine synthetase family protein [Rhodospirillum rubrum]MBK1665149.1 glutamine synthetase [Rhodospirillum rubrum]MBK1676394.1 glutamine synthetase [Rhodospirillum rubrum]
MTVLPPADGGALLREEVRRFREAHPDIAYVDLLSLDLPGHFYGKRLPIAMLDDIAAGAPLKLPQNAIILGATGGVYPIGRYALEDGDPDAPRRLVAGTLAPVPWESRPTAQMLVTSSGTDHPVCFEPREVLNGVVERLRAKGLFPTVAFELEFYLLSQDRPDGLIAPPRDPLSGRADLHPAMHIERLSRFSDVLHAIIDAAQAQGIETTAMSAEVGLGQYEINFAHCADPLRAADWSALFCRATRGVAMRHGYQATFLSKPYLQSAGSGMHLHVSLCDELGANLLAPDNALGLKRAVAGCLALMPASVALFSANHNAFRRSASGAVNTAAGGCWGWDDRSAGIRIPPSGPAALRLEHRVAGADANPYLALAAILAGMDYGLECALDPRPTREEAPSASVALPGDMLEALRAMDASAELRARLGDEFVTVYTTMKRQDHLAFLGTISPREYDWYL